MMNMYTLGPSELHDKGIQTLPRNLSEAVEEFEKDPLSRQTFGDDMFEAFVEYKKQEWLDYHNHVSDWELQRYLTMD